MTNITSKVIQFFKNKWYRNAEMVQYWKTKVSVEAKVTRINGSYVMLLEGEKYPFPGFPRGTILYNTVSKLKHEIKNQLFNDSWRRLEEDVPEYEVISEAKRTLWEIKKLFDGMRFNLLPVERMCPAVKEIWRAWSVVEKDFKGEKLELSRALKEIMCFILQEDDGYRFRVQWVMKFFPKKPKTAIKVFDYALSLIEHAEVIGDMRERMRLLRRILMVLLNDKGIGGAFETLCKEWDVKKIRLNKADKYYFRGKYFRVDYPEYKY